MKKYQKLYTTVIYLFVSLFAQFSQSQITPIDVGSTMHLAIMETTDLHGHVRSYDYLKNQPDLNKKRQSQLQKMGDAKILLNPV